jgi:hypothetical protein
MNPPAMLAGNGRGLAGRKPARLSLKDCAMGCLQGGAGRGRTHWTSRFCSMNAALRPGCRLTGYLGVWTHRAGSRVPGATWGEPLPEGPARSAACLISTVFQAPRLPRDESRQDRREPLMHPRAWSASVRRIGFSSQVKSPQAAADAKPGSSSSSPSRRPHLNSSC